MRNSKRWLIVLLTLGFLLLPGGPAQAAPENGWYWNSSESGRGFFIEMKGPVLFMAGYFYADDGRGTWMVSGGPIPDLYHYTGRLFSVSGGQTLVGPYVAPTSSADVGEIKLDFTDDTHCTLTWPGGTIQLERQIFGEGGTSFQPTGWWWNENESGRGFSIEVQGDTLDVVAFMYDGVGNPVWYISSGKMGSPTHYAGRLDQIFGGQTMSGPYQAPTTVTGIGGITIDFASLEAGTITLSDVVPTADAKALKSSVTIDITPQLPNPPLTDLPADWGGTFTGMLISDPPGSDNLTITAEGDVTWTDVANVPGNTIVFPATATPARAYVVSGGTATLTFAGSGTFPVVGQPLTCTANGSATVSLAAIFGNSFLQFEANGVVTGQIATAGEIPFTITATCTTQFGTIVVSPQYPVQVTVPVSGRHRYNHSEGSDPLHEIAPNVQAGATWSFSGLPTP